MDGFTLMSILAPLHPEQRDKILEEMKHQISLSLAEATNIFNEL